MLRALLLVEYFLSKVLPVVLLFQFPDSVSATFLSVGLVGATAPTSADLGGALVSTATPSGYTAGNMNALSMTTTGLLRVDGSNVTQPVSGTVTANAGTGNFTVVQATAASLNATVVGTGTGGAVNVAQATAANLNATVVASGNFNNASVSTTGSAPPASATYSGASVTTAAPTYTTGQMSGLSLNTAGGLRLDGVSATGTTTGTTAMLNGAAVTTAAPSYTTGQMSAMSLTTTGLLRIDGVYPLNTTTPTSDITFIGGAVTTAAPSYTTGQLSALSLDVAGNLRVTALTNKASTSDVTSVAGTTSSSAVLASNANRIFASIYNNTNKNMYVLLGSGTASTSNFSILLMTTAYWEVPNDYTGAINAIWAGGVSGSALVTELTP